jgi:hypothetical protein
MDIRNAYRIFVKEPLEKHTSLKGRWKNNVRKNLRDSRIGAG